MEITRKEFLLFGSLTLGALLAGGISWLAGSFGKPQLFNGIALHPADHWRLADHWRRG